MSFIKRIRLWLQKPWFVGLLSVIAILYSARNIVLPLIDLSSNKPKQGAIAKGSTSSPLLPGGGDSPEVQLKIGQLRLTQLTGISYRRNPFLLANDPRQPGFELTSQLAVAKVYTGEVKTGESLHPTSLFELNAILDRDGRRVAMINRQVSSQGDLIKPQLNHLDEGALSLEQHKQLREMLAMQYELTLISSDGVEITGDMGLFKVSFRY